MKINELIEILRDESNPNVLDYIDEAADALEAQQKRIEELEQERRWISVKDRLPEKEGDYLIYATAPFNGRKLMAVMHYEKGAYLPIWSDTTHWMPLPQPPKGE